MLFLQSALFVCWFGFLTPSSATRLSRGCIPKLTSENFTCCHTVRDRAGKVGNNYNLRFFFLNVHTYQSHCISIPASISYSVRLNEVFLDVVHTLIDLSVSQFAPTCYETHKPPLNVRHMICEKKAGSESS